MTTEFIRASRAEMRRTFSDWKEPLAEPVKRAIRNPFTRAEEVTWSWDPSPEAAARNTGSALHFTRVSMVDEGLSFEGLAVLELAHVLLTSDEAAALVRALFPPGTSSANWRLARPALVGPSDGPWVWEVPPQVVARLATMTEAETIDAGARWQAFDHEWKRENFPDVLFDDFDAQFFAETLRLLGELSRTLQADDRLYELCSPPW